MLSHKTSIFAGRAVGTLENDVNCADDSGVRIDGYLGDDLIVGGTDVLFGVSGGSGADTFVFSSLLFSTRNIKLRIADFVLDTEKISLDSR